MLCVEYMQSIQTKSKMGNSRYVTEILRRNASWQKANRNGADFGQQSGD